MSTEYADRVTKEILAKVNGQAKLAEQAIRTLISRDPKFLHSLVTPYLDGIILHAIERARKPHEATAAKAAPKRPSAVTQPKPVKTATPIPAKGFDGLMAAWAKSFEKDAPPPSTGGKKVSANHLAAMQALIKKK